MLHEASVSFGITMWLHRLSAASGAAEATLLETDSRMAGSA